MSDFGEYSGKSCVCFFCWDDRKRGSSPDGICLFCRGVKGDRLELPPTRAGPIISAISSRVSAKDDSACEYADNLGELVLALWDLLRSHGYDDRLPSAVES